MQSVLPWHLKPSRRTSKRLSAPARQTAATQDLKPPSGPPAVLGTGPLSAYPYAKPWHKIQHGIAQQIQGGTQQNSVRCGIACPRSTQHCQRGAALNPRADWLGGHRRAGPFILPSVFASRIRSRLRPAASRALRTQRRLNNSEGAAGAARWRQEVCTVECNLRTCVGAFRLLRRRSTEHVRSAG